MTWLAILGPGFPVREAVIVRTAGPLLIVFGLLLLAGFLVRPVWHERELSAAQRSEAATVARIRPPGEVCLDGQPCGLPAAAMPDAATPLAAPTAVASASPSAASPAASSASSRAGQLVATVCATCHGAGLLGAPVLGNRILWAPRIAQGKAALYDHALHGFHGAMPPKGGCTTCSDDDIRAAVDLMVSKAGE